MEAREWAEWWRRRGERKLELLLWALWDPIGGVPLDEYGSYCTPVIKLLRQSYGADAPLAERSYFDAVQRERNKLWQVSVDALTRLLADLRVANMEIERDERIDREAAEKLLEWYGWEMEAIANSQGGRDRNARKPGDA